jgi:hypothetical protein
MKLLKLGLLLVVLVGMVAVVDAHTYTQTFSSGTQPLNGPFTFGSLIKDEVSTNSNELSMSFTWMRPDGTEALKQISTRTSRNENYISNLNGANAAGEWKVRVTENANTDTATFKVNAAPEFTFGSFISLFAAGGLFLVMRRKV